MSNIEMDEDTKDMLFIMSVTKFVEEKPQHATRITDANITAWDDLIDKMLDK